uniref:Uncharacterized protein n=1 Tax=Avena sativa TaxID=4498 RepID=A0ACD5ZCD0_AVESA
MRAYSTTPSAASAVSLPSAAAPPLTPDVAAVLSRAAGDASRRRHAHTTPLHAAAALLSGPAPLLRDACVAGLSSPHPLRCRALDLCFAVALDRLPTSTELHHGHQDGFRGAPPPPLSNALSAALKRAYAHHRRIGGSGAVDVGGDDHRVGVPHLVLAILDDPSVARVMREASFCSTAVKAAMLRSLSDPAAPDSGVYVSATRSLQQHRQASTNRDEEVAKVVDVLKRDKKRNPVLVGDTADVDAVVQEVVAMIQRQRLGNARVIEFGNLVDMDRSELVAKIGELGEAIRSELLAPAMATQSAGVVVNLGNLQWLVEERCPVPSGEPQETRRGMVLDTARAAVAEMARVLELSGDSERRRVWVIGTATCATYLKCQVYHPALESEWDIQAVPITPRPPPTPSSLGLSPSGGANRGILSSSVEVLSSAMTGATAHRPTPGMCNSCMDGYERERAEMSSSDASHLNPAEKTMSRWLQIGTPANARPAPFDHAQVHEKEREADELRRRWLDRCAQLHSYGRPSAAVTCSEWNGASVLSSMQAAMPVRPSAPPSGRVVDTDLALGPASSGRPATSVCDTDVKMLMKRLTEAVRWQPEAAAAVADTIVKARLGDGKRRCVAAKADTWVLFVGADVAGKRRMADALSVAVFGAGAVTVRLGCAATVDRGEESVVSCRGRTALDRVAEAVRANPFRVIVLDELDHADDLVHGAIVRAVESGRLVDSHGRDVALGSAIFVVISSWSSWTSPDHPTDSRWNLELRVRHGTPKRMPEQPLDGARRVKARRQLPLDLNLSMCDDHIHDDGDDSGGEGSRNSSSDLTVEHEQEYAQPAYAATRSAQSNVHELIRAVDGTVVFRPVDFEPLKRSVSDIMSAKFGNGGWSVQVDAGVLDRLAGAAWTAAGASSATSLEAWADDILCPSLRQLKRSLSSNDADGATTVSLSSVEDIGRRRMDGGVFPTSATVAVDGN